MAAVALATGVVVTLKFALVAPAGTVTVEETAAAGWLLETATSAPPAGAGPFSVMVPVAEVAPVTLVGLTASEDTTGARTVSDALCVAPP